MAHQNREIFPQALRGRRSPDVTRNFGSAAPRRWPEELR
jgi:hypothetical protein